MGILDGKQNTILQGTTEIPENKQQQIVDSDKKVDEYVWDSWDDDAKSDVLQIIDPSKTPPTSQVGAPSNGTNGGVQTNGTQQVNDVGAINANNLVGDTKSANDSARGLYESWKKELGKNRSAYETLVKSSFKNRLDLAKRRERDARSVALANALGSIVNVITAGAMGTKGDYAPIIAEYDSTPDTELKKSIAARYALENENEGLLMQLVKDRMNAEAEIANKGYEVGMSAINRDLATSTAIYNKAMDRLSKQEEREWKETQAQLEREHKSSEAEKKREFDKEENKKNRQAQIAAAKLKAQNGLTEGQATFVLGVAQGRQQTRITKDYMGMPTTNIGEASISPTDIKALTSIYNRLVGEGLNREQIDKAMGLYRTAWHNSPASAMDESLYDTVINEVKK